MLAAAALGRHVRGSEVNSDYVGLATRRFDGHGLPLVLNQGAGVWA